MLLRASRDRSHAVRVGVTRRVVGALIVTLAGSALFSTPAYAYLDPGTGNVMLQLLLGGLAGVAAVVKLYWAQIVRFVRGRFAPVKGPSLPDVKGSSIPPEPQATITDRQKHRS